MENDIEICFDCDNGEALQLVKVEDNQSMSLVKSTVDKILEYDGNIGIVSVLGKYRTGKSFLINSILGIKGKGFQISPSVQACTKGIWIWS